MICKAAYSWAFFGACMIIMFIFITLILILYTLIHKIQRLQFINERLSCEEGRINDVSAMLETCRQIRHDFKQHLTVIGGFLENGKNDECRAYVAELCSSANHMVNMIQSGNTVIDYLVNSKLYPLEDTQVTVKGNIGDLSDIDEIDLSCMIGNILDNAVEAVKLLKEKKIELTFAVQNSNRIIICCNSIGESVLEKNKFLASTKGRAGEHGLGHMIIARIVQKYDGILSYFEENNMFGVQIILPQISVVSA